MRDYVSRDEAGAAAMESSGPCERPSAAEYEDPPPEACPDCGEPHGGPACSEAGA